MQKNNEDFVLHHKGVYEKLWTVSAKEVEKLYQGLRGLSFRVELF